MRIHPLKPLFLLSAVVLFLGIDCYQESYTPISGEVASFALYEAESYWVYEQVGNPAVTDSLFIVSDQYSVINGGRELEEQSDLRLQEIEWRGKRGFWDCFAFAPYTTWSFDWAEFYYSPEQTFTASGQVLLTGDDQSLFPYEDNRLILRQEYPAFTLNGTDYGRTLELELIPWDSARADTVPMLREIWVSQGTGIIRHAWTDSTEWELVRHQSIPTVLSP